MPDDEDEKSLGNWRFLSSTWLFDVYDCLFRIIAVNFLDKYEKVGKRTKKEQNINATTRCAIVSQCLFSFLVANGLIFR